MVFTKALVVCLYLSVLLTEILGLPGSGGGRSGLSSGKSTSSKGFPGAIKNNGKQAIGTDTGEAKPLKVSKAGGGILSAWGLISLILFIIVGSALAYYTSVFYPLICAKRGKYDVMEMTTV